MVMYQVPKRTVSFVLILVLILSLIQVYPASTVQAAAGDNLGILDIEVNKPVHAQVDHTNATIDISLPYGTLYQMLNVTTNPGAAATLYRGDGTTAISFAVNGLNKGDAKLDQFSTSGTTLYDLVVTDKNDSSNSRIYTITVTVNQALPPITGTMGPNDTFSPLNIQAGENAWDVMGASRIGNGSTTGSVEGPGTPSSYSGKSWSESVYDRAGDYPVASTVNESWLGDNMYLQTIGSNDLNALSKYGIATIPGTNQLNSDILRFHEFLPFVTQDGVSRDDGDRGAVGSDRQRLEIKSNTSAANADANSVGGDIMTHHWRFMLPSETLRFQKDVGDKKAGDFIVPRRFWHIFQLKEVSGNAAGQPVATLTLASSGGVGLLEFRNNPDGSSSDRYKRLFRIPFDQVVDRWLDMEVTILTADNGYLYGKLTDLETGEVLSEGGMTAETYRRPEVKNPVTGRLERGDLPVEPGQQNRSKWGLYRGMYNGSGDAAIADEFQAATMYLADTFLIKRDENSYIFPDGWNPNAQPKDVVAWARPNQITVSKGTEFTNLGLPIQLDVTMSTGKTEKVNVTWNPDDYKPDSMGVNKIYGTFIGTGFTNTKNIRPYIEVNISDSKNWAVTPGAEIKVVSQSSGTKNGFIDGKADTFWQAHSSLASTAANYYQYWAAIKLEQKIDISKIQMEWTSNSTFLKNYQVYYTDDADAYHELVEGGSLSDTSAATRRPLDTTHGASWKPIPGVGKTTPLANNEKASHTLSEPIGAQYLLLLSDVRLQSGAGGIKSNVFNVIGSPTRPKAALEDLKLDGTTIANFIPSQTSYTHMLSGSAITLPNVEAAAPAGMDVNIVYPTDYRYDPVVVTVSDPSRVLAETIYKIHFDSSNEDLILVNSFILSKSSQTIKKGASEQLAATVSPDDATNKTVAWHSSDNTVATVDQNGLVTGIKEGNVIITATVGRFVKECAVHITDIVSITPISMTTYAGTAPALPTVVTAVYSDNTTQLRAVTWNNIDASQYAAPGNFSVQGTVTGTTYKALANITVIAVEIVSITPISITTKAGTAPAMPTVVTAVYNNNTTQLLAVTWGNIDASQYASAGSFKVQGTVTGTSIKAEATVTVTQPTWPSNSTLTFSDVTKKTATLNWTPAESSRGISGYKIYSKQGQKYVEIASLGNVLKYELTGLAPGRNYTFMIEAIDTDGTRSVYGPSVSLRTKDELTSSDTNSVSEGDQ